MKDSPVKEILVFIMMIPLLSFCLSNILHTFVDTKIKAEKQNQAIKCLSTSLNYVVQCDCMNVCITGLSLSQL